MAGFKTCLLSSCLTGWRLLITLKLSLGIRLGSESVVLILYQLNLVSRKNWYEFQIMERDTFQCLPPIEMVSSNPSEVMKFPPFRCDA